MRLRVPWAPQVPTFSPQKEVSPSDHPLLPSPASQYPHLCQSETTWTTCPSDPGHQQEFGKQMNEQLNE